MHGKVLLGLGEMPVDIGELAKNYGGPVLDWGLDKLEKWLDSSNDEEEVLPKKEKPPKLSSKMIKAIAKQKLVEASKKQHEENLVQHIIKPTPKIPLNMQW